MTPFDLEQLRLGPATVSPTLRARPKSSRRSNRLFLKGPISWNWLCAAARQPGRALQVALAIRLWVGIKKSNRVQLSTSKLIELGMNRHAVYRGLRALENAGLVTVVRHTGRVPWVTVVELDGNSEVSGA